MILPFSKIWNQYHNPLYIWWKARKYFKKPKVRFYCGKPFWFYGWPINIKYINPIIDIRLSSLGWKDKYNTPRHEWDPYISITILRRFRLLWIWNYIDINSAESTTQSMATWEAILDYLYYNKTLKESIDNHIWISSNGDKITINKNLK